MIILSYHRFERWNSILHSKIIFEHNALLFLLNTFKHKLEYILIKIKYSYLWLHIWQAAKGYTVALYVPTNDFMWINALFNCNKNILLNMLLLYGFNDQSMHFCIYCKIIRWTIKFVYFMGRTILELKITTTYKFIHLLSNRSTSYNLSPRIQVFTFII